MHKLVCIITKLISILSFLLIGLPVIFCHLSGGSASQPQVSSTTSKAAHYGDRVLSRTIFVAESRRDTNKDRLGQAQLPLANANQLVQFDSEQRPETHPSSADSGTGHISKVALAPLRWRPPPMASEAQFEQLVEEKRAGVNLYQLANRSSLSSGGATRAAQQDQDQNQDQDQGRAGEINELNGDFLGLFDELWRLKNSTVTTLVRLEYFQNQTGESLDEKEADKDRCSDDYGNCATTATPVPGFLPAQRPALADAPTFGSKPGSGTKLIKPPVIVKQQQIYLKASPPSLGLNWAQAAARINGWFSAAQLRLRQLNEKLFSVLKGKPFSRQQQAPPKSNPGNESSLLEELAAGASSEPMVQDASELDLQALIQEQQRVKRQIGAIHIEATSINNSPYQQQRHRQKLEEQQDQNCVNLTIDEEYKCRATELTINTSLNNSFPGSLSAIEDNCRQITFLLSYCWPQDLTQLKQSLASWNESLLIASEFTLPLLVENGAGLNNSSLRVLPSGPPSCGVGEPRSPQVIRDRVSWMWLNLCMDKQFRLDYVQNLRCLGSWNQERAQQVCNHEYKQMHGYLAHQAEINAAAGNAISNSLGTGYSNLDSAITYYNNGNKLDPEQLESREVSSKMLCCMFDQFLRCVHRQASRDCGRPGAQFVVNFMSRIGTDDMKYLCNGESRYLSSPLPTSSNVAREQHHQQQYVGGNSASNGNTNRMKTQSNNRKGHHQHHDRSPFIDGNYCTDIRIQSALQNVSAQYGDSTRGGRHPSSGPGTSNLGLTGTRSATNHLRSKARPSINHDPTFFGSDESSASSASDQFQNITNANGTWLLFTLVVIYHIFNRLI